MTDREKAIVMAFTGYAMLTGDKLGLYYNYIEEKLGRPVMTHELAEKPMQETIHVLSQPDFIELCRASDKLVTCGECANWTACESEENDCSYYGVCSQLNRMTYYDWFCADGEVETYADD